MYQAYRTNPHAAVGPAQRRKRDVVAGLESCGCRMIDVDHAIGPDGAVVHIVKEPPRQNPAVTFDIDERMADLLFDGAAYAPVGGPITEMLLKEPYFRDQAASWLEGTFRNWNYEMTGAEAGAPSLATLEAFAQVIRSVVGPMYRAGLLDRAGYDAWIAALYAGVKRNTKLDEYTRQVIMRRV